MSSHDNNSFALFLLSAPSGPPTEILPKPVASTKVNISWSPPLPNQTNGIIKSYQLCYSTERLQSNCSSKGNVSKIKSENEFVELEGLLPATLYYFRVRAKTIAGAGPYTKEYKIITGSGEILYFVPCRLANCNSACRRCKGELPVAQNSV